MKFHWENFSIFSQSWKAQTSEFLSFFLHMDEFEALNKSCANKAQTNSIFHHDGFIKKFVWTFS